MGREKLEWQKSSLLAYGATPICTCWHMARIGAADRNGGWMWHKGHMQVLSHLLRPTFPKAIPPFRPTCLPSPCLKKPLHRLNLWLIKCGHKHLGTTRSKDNPLQMMRWVAAPKTLGSTAIQLLNTKGELASYENVGLPKSITVAEEATTFQVLKYHELLHSEDSRDSNFVNPDNLDNSVTKVSLIFFHFLHGLLIVPISSMRSVDVLKIKE